MKTQRQRDEKRLLLLCSKNYFSWWQTQEFKLDDYEERYSDVKRYPYYKEPLEIAQLFKKLHYTDEDAAKFWLNTYTIQRMRHEGYNAKPKGKRQDNKDYYNGNGGSNRNKVRYPKKCRKTAWKRFYKLFPHLKDNK